MGNIKQLNLEAILWLAAFIVLYFVDVSGSSHFTICPLKNIGIDFCPGCGLGASIHYLLHLDFVNSFNAHPLGIPAFIILFFRSTTLLKDYYLKRKLSLNNY